MRNRSFSLTFFLMLGVVAMGEAAAAPVKLVGFGMVSDKPEEKG